MTMRDAALGDVIPVDVNLAIGGYPYRHVPHPEPAVLARVLERERIAAGWVAHLPAAFWRDPAPGDAALYAALAPFPSLQPVPTIRPDWPGWERRLREAVDRGAPAVRAYPTLWGLGAGDGAMARLGAACARAGLVLVLPVRFEDLRQRHPLDVGGDLSPAQVRAVVRHPDAPHTVVLSAGREFIEETHWALTVEERARLWFDFSWVWGPPEDHLALLFRTIGAERFVHGTGWPLRLTQNPAANLALLPDDLRDARPTGGDAILASARAAAGIR
jgi:hypothetical protein